MVACYYTYTNVAGCAGLFILALAFHCQTLQGEAAFCRFADIVGDGGKATIAKFDSVAVNVKTVCNLICAVVVVVTFFNRNDTITAHLCAELGFDVLSFHVVVFRAVF